MQAQARELLENSTRRELQSEARALGQPHSLKKLARLLLAELLARADERHPLWDPHIAIITVCPPAFCQLQ